MVTSDTIQSLQGECHRASKRHKSTSAALHQQVDNLIELVKSFLAQHQEQEQENASPEAGKLFMRVQLPQFASELKKLMKKVSTAYRELQSQSIAPMGKSIDRSFVQNQEAFLDHYMETNGFSATINTTTTTGSTTGTASDTTALFDEDALKLVVMQHLVREVQDACIHAFVPSIVFFFHLFDALTLLYDDRPSVSLSSFPLCSFFKKGSFRSREHTGGGDDTVIVISCDRC